MRMLMIAAACLCASALVAETLETDRWQTAIDDAAKAGGGRVTVPAGRHRVGGLEMRSNVELHLEKGAVLEGVVGLENYRLVELPYSEGVWSAVVMGLNVTNVAITGEGEIFGNGRSWPQPEDFRGNQEGRRARGVFFSESKGIRLSDFFLHDVGCWGVVLKCCDGVVAHRVRISNHVNANNDGFDIEAANAVFEECDVSTSDDAFTWPAPVRHRDRQFVALQFRGEFARMGLEHTDMLEWCNRAFRATRGKSPRHCAGVRAVSDQGGARRV